MKKFLVPVFMVSLGLNLLIGFQNCAEVDPNFAYQETDSDLKANNTKAKKEEAPKRYADISELKINESKVTRYQRSVHYQLEAEFRVKYTNQYLGANPEILNEKISLLDKQNRIVANLRSDKIDVLEQNCVESVDVHATPYFDCKYKLLTKQKLDISPKSFKKGQYRIGNQRGVLELALLIQDTTLRKKDYLVVSDYVDRYSPIKQKKIVKKKTPLPKVSKTKKKTKVKKAVAKKPKAKKKKVSKKKIEDKKIVEGIHCHIQVLNPPHLELLSDIKKTGLYYEDTQNCREAAIRLSKKYCDRSLMGEIDYNIRIKDATKAGTKVLEKHIESIECGDLT